MSLFTSFVNKLKSNILSIINENCFSYILIIQSLRTQSLRKNIHLDYPNTMVVREKKYAFFGKVRYHLILLYVPFL